MKNSIYFKLFYIAAIAAIIFSGSKLCAQKIEIEIKTSELLKDGQFTWPITDIDLIRLSMANKQDALFELKFDPEINAIQPKNLNSKIRKAFFKKELRSLNIKIKSENRDKLGRLVILRNEQSVVPGISLSNNNVSIVLDACKNKISIISQDKKPRQSLYMKHNEVLTFEIDNVNLLKNEYTLSHSTLNFNVNFEDIDRSFISKEPPEGIVKQDCLEKIKLLLKLQIDVSMVKTNYSYQDCIDREELKNFLKQVYNSLYNTFSNFAFESMVFNIETTLKNSGCSYSENLSEFLTYKDYKGTPTGLQDSFKKTIDLLKKDVADLYLLMNTPKVVSLPVYIKGQNADLIRYTVKKEARENNSSFSVETEEVSYDIEIRRGFKIDVSAGIYFTGLTDENYYLKDNAINDTIYKKIIKDNKSSVSLSVGSMVNLNWRCGNNWSAGFSFGAAFPFTNEKISPQFLGGGTFLVGREQRFGITGGAVYGLYSDLRNGYDVNKSYNITDNTVPMTTIDKVSWFVGIVYNLGKTKILEKE